jgi:hypothetical protein
VVYSLTGKTTSLKADSIVLVKGRMSNAQLYQDLGIHHENGTLSLLRIIGDAEAPSTITQTVYAFHRAAQEFDDTIDPDARSKLDLSRNAARHSLA